MKSKDTLFSIEYKITGEAIENCGSELEKHEKKHALIELGQAVMKQYAVETTSYRALIHGYFQEFTNLDDLKKEAGNKKLDYTKVVRLTFRMPD